MPAPIRTAALTACAVAIAAAWPAMAAPVLRGADLHVAMDAPTACRVRLSVVVEGVSSVEHRIEVLDGATVTLDRVDGATVEGAPRDIGRTRALSVRPDATRYTLEYSVTQPDAGAFRCPVWLPTTPADGRSREVRIRAALPAGAVPAGTMPAFTWTGGDAGREGAAALGHLPAFVRIPYSAPGVAAPWNVGASMEAASLAVLALASAFWWRRRERGRG